MYFLVLKILLNQQLSHLGNGVAYLFVVNPLQTSSDTWLSEFTESVICQGKYHPKYLKINPFRSQKQLRKARIAPAILTGSALTTYE